MQRQVSALYIHRCYINTFSCCFQNACNPFLRTTSWYFLLHKWVQWNASQWSLFPILYINIPDKQFYVRGFQLDLTDHFNCLNNTPYFVPLPLIFNSLNIFLHLVDGFEVVQLPHCYTRIAASSVDVTVVVFVLIKVYLSDTGLGLIPVPLGGDTHLFV